MKAILITACGCRRVLNVKDAAWRIHVPIPQNSVQLSASAPLPRLEISEREFLYWGHTSRGTHVYREVVR